MSTVGKFLKRWTGSDDQILSDGRSLKACLDTAIESGKLKLGEDNRIEFASYAFSGAWVSHWPGQHSRIHYYTCSFLFGFLFDIVYQRKTIPANCANCYKVKCEPDTLKQLMALEPLQSNQGENCKIGCQILSPYSQDIWTGVIYTDGLDRALKIHDRFRRQVDAHPDLGKAIPTSVQRGCTEYEMELGPSDQWCFEQSDLKLEQQLWAAFSQLKTTKQAHKMKNSAALVQLIQFAHQIGDDTYLELTGGKRIYPKPVNYLQKHDTDRYSAASTGTSNSD